MFLIWRGWGVLAVVIPIVFMFIVEFAVNATFGDGFYQKSSWTLSLVLILSAVSIYLVGTKLNGKKARIVIDKETNEEMELKSTHSLFWIPLQYWGFIMFALGVWAFISKMR